MTECCHAKLPPRPSRKARSALGRLRRAALRLRSASQSLSEYFGSHVQPRHFLM
jgi:hypothetical protein